MAELNNTLETSARGINRKLVKLFGGDMMAAAKAVEDLASEPEVLQAWATRMIRREEQFAPAFSFDELPTNMKATAARGMAMAYLTCTMTHQDSEVS